MSSLLGLKILFKNFDSRDQLAFFFSQDDDGFIQIFNLLFKLAVR